MVYRQLFDRSKPADRVRAGVIGAGHYATAVVTQSRDIPRLEVPAIADVSVKAARQAYRHAGFADEDVVVCESHNAALQAIERGQQVILPDSMLLMELPVDVIVESTGVPEAGARHALAAIRHGKHVAMVNKETDVVVGPILKHLADQAGVVYTAVDGDQPSLLIGLVTWAQELGLEVLCGGKSLEFDLVFDAAAETVSFSDRVLPLDASEVEIFNPIPHGQVARVVNRRRALLGDLGQSAGAYAELAIVANATGLIPDAARLHCPVVRTAEIPEVLCPVDEGGILGQRGVIDAVTSLRHPHEAGLGGGVFVVVACANDYSRHILTTKGLISNSNGSAALIYRPYHLCGVETAISILCATLLGVPTGAVELSPRFDVIARATENLKAGEPVDGDSGPGLEARMLPAQPVMADRPLPYFMAHGNVLAVDVPAGTMVTADMVVAPPDSTLWSLRVQQDRRFFDRAKDPFVAPR
jgi:predicted homoserine dehydrogenase-like protein